MKILLTGATGFIGSEILRKLSMRGVVVNASYRNEFPLEPSLNLIPFNTGDILASTNWEKPLRNVDVVIHTAARAHIINDKSIEPLDEFRLTNTKGTLNLARQAAKEGVKRFVFLSSIGVNGSCNTKPFVETDSPNPTEPYAISKYEAEQGLLEISGKTGLEVVIIRPPLVYGPKAPGNFSTLVKWVGWPIPLPLGSIHNKRSFISIENLVSFIELCIEHPKAANETFVVSDGVDVSTTELLNRVGMAIGKPTRLIPVPSSWLMVAATMLGKRDVAIRLLGSLQVDSGKARELLGWIPPVSMEESLRKIAKVEHQIER